MLTTTFSALRSGSPACLPTCRDQLTFAMQHSQALLQLAAKETLTLGLHTTLFFFSPKRVEMLMSAHNVFPSTVSFFSRIRNQAVLSYPKVGNLNTRQLLKIFPMTDAKHFFLNPALVQIFGR